MKKNNKNNNHKILNKNYIKGAISGALALTILCSGVGVAAYSAGADNTAQALGVQTESTVEAVKKASTTKEALKKLSKNETVYVIADSSGAAKKIIVSDWLKGVDSKGKVKDVSNLKDVINVKGDETYTVNEDNAYEWAANGDDIYYQASRPRRHPLVCLRLPDKAQERISVQRQGYIRGGLGRVRVQLHPQYAERPEELRQHQFIGGYGEDAALRQYIQRCRWYRASRTGRSLQYAGLRADGEGPIRQ